MPAMLKLRLLPHLIAAARRDGWNRARLGAWQCTRLAKLVAFARANSPFYASSLAGKAVGDLKDLPILTKGQLVAEWDRIVTDRALKKQDVLHFLASRTGEQELYLGRNMAMATSGSTGERIPFVFSRNEWMNVMVTVARLTRWRDGFGPGRYPAAYIFATARSAPAGAPMSVQIAQTAIAISKGGFFLDAALPLTELVAVLNRIQPQILVSFASTLTMLAQEQIAGRLRLSLKGVNSSSEVLTSHAADLIEQAFGVRAFDTYAMTEAGVAAAACSKRGGMHILEDLSILEVVDEDYRPVADGTFGSRVLVTNLWNRTLPLIRYEITDRVKLAKKGCTCGLPFTLIEEIDGRSADMLVLPGADGQPIPVAPSQIQAMLHGYPVTVWQFTYDGSHLKLAAVVSNPSAESSLAAGLRDGLKSLGIADIRVEVEIRDAIKPEPTGKIRRFVREDDHATRAI